MNDTEREAPALRFTRVARRFGRRRVLEDVSLEVMRGESFGLVGMNGAGKTTCIKGLLDFSALDGGAIEIFGIAHTETRARARLAYLPERFLPPHYLTGRDFLRYMSRLHRLRYSETDARRMCASLDLDADALDRPVHEYSKGMAQKLGLCSCFLSERDLFVLDEPMSGLDARARLRVKQRLLGLKARGRSLFFTAHVLGDVEALCDRMGILHAGVLQFVGTPAECRRQYAAHSLERAYLNCIDACV